MKQTLELRDGWAIRALDTHGRLSREQVDALRREAGDDGDWLRATMPAQVQDVLLAHGLIPNPAGFDQARRCLWVSDADWVYRTAFDRPAGDGPIYLHLAGLDTLVDVYVNGQHLVFHNDIYLPLRLDVTDLLEARNDLLLHFYSPRKYLETLELPEAWKGKVDKNRLLRKPHEDFNHFNGAHPYYTPIGVYDTVTLETVDTAEIGRPDLTVRLDEDYNRAGVEAAFNVGPGEADAARMTIRDPEGDVVTRSRTVIEDGRARLFAVVEAPRLWWPRGYGDQPLYEVEIELTAAGRVLDRVTRRTGFREIRIDHRLDCRVNGQPVKLWGANFTPIEGLSHVWRSDRCRVLLDQAENAHFTSLRIWGPGAPYHRELYEEADRRGLLLWDEFFHTWGFYPDDDDYRDLCRREAAHHVRTHKHHPSILLWCGGNENAMSADVDFPGQDVIGRAIWEEDYRAVCAELDPDRYYHVNSPSGGAWANDPLAGDSHSYTHQWLVPGEAYPVLFTENTRISPPPARTMRKWLGDGEQYWPEGYVSLVKCQADDPFPPAWMKLTLGHDFVLARPGPVGEFFETVETPEGLIYRYSAAHCEYIRRYVERYRRGKAADDPGPRRTMGHYLWKYNNTWPMIFSGVVDYELEEKMAYYALRRAYSPVLLSFEIGDHIHLWAVNDTPSDITGSVLLRMFDTEATDLQATIRQHVHVPAGASKPLLNLDQLGSFRRFNVLFAELFDAWGRRLARVNDFADIERHIHFPPCRLHMDYEGDGRLRITTDRFARSVELSGLSDEGDAFGWRFEDNFFDLLPCESRTVRILGPSRKGEVTAKGFFSDHATTVEVF